MDKILNSSENIEIVNAIREIYATASPTQLRDLIASHFIPSEKERKSHAEIPTPVKLVDEMLDHMPVEFWTRPHKVFEPCCGKGNFVIGIFDRFFKGLENTIKDKRLRCQIIMTECLYYADINPLNVFITTEIMKCHVRYHSGDDNINYTFNSYVGDTLKMDIGKQWNLKGFDAVIGNPPFQSEQKHAGKRGGGDLLWNKFVVHMINIVTVNGYLCFIHPPGWRKPESERSKFKNLFEIMAHENYLIYLELHDSKDGKKLFNSGTMYDWYVLQKTHSINKTTKIRDFNGNIIITNLDVWSWLPNYNLDKIYQLLASDREETCKIIYNRNNYGSDKNWMSKEQDDEHPHSCVHSTPKTGTRYYYSSRNDNGHFGIPKVIFGESGINEAILDISGQYCMTQEAMAIVDNMENLPKIKRAIESKEFNDVLSACKWSNFRIDWRLFTYFKRNFWKYFVEEQSKRVITKKVVIKKK